LSGGSVLRRGVGGGVDGVLGLGLVFGRFGSGGGLFAGCQRDVPKARCRCGPFYAALCGIGESFGCEACDSFRSGRSGREDLPGNHVRRTRIPYRLIYPPV
jgi:hypothetical protein